MPDEPVLSLVLQEIMLRVVIEEESHLDGESSGGEGQERELTAEDVQPARHHREEKEMDVRDVHRDRHQRVGDHQMRRRDADRELFSRSEEAPGERAGGDRQQREVERGENARPAARRIGDREVRELRIRPTGAVWRRLIVKIEAQTLRLLRHPSLLR